MLAELAAVLPGALGYPFVALDDFFRAGGVTTRVIFVAALVMWTLIVERYWYFSFVFPKRLRQIRGEWDARATHRTWSARRIRAAMISEMNVAMQSGLQLMKVIIPICPLLGLVGTIAGMLEVFDVMALRGAVDARAMANGVSHAMIATLSGLGVAISGMFFVNRFQARVRVQTELLADQLKYN